MPGLAIHLLGPPTGAVRRHSPPPPPRGRKAWALLAHLLLSDGAPVPRERLAGLLFEDADDPLGALRWNLARSAACSATRARCGRPRPAPRAAAGDVRRRPDRAGTGSWIEAIGVPGLGHDLLEGMDFPSCPSFDAWLINERRHLQAGCEAVLHEAAVAGLAAGAHGVAADHATRLVALDPTTSARTSCSSTRSPPRATAATAAHQPRACRVLSSASSVARPGPPCSPPPTSCPPPRRPRRR